jgi:hypothetical protein
MKWKAAGKVPGAAFQSMRADYAQPDASLWTVEQMPCHMAISSAYLKMSGI